MTRLTGAALDRAVAHAMGLKSVHNCEQWGGKNMPLEVRGGWTYKDVLDMEDNVEQERFEVTDTYARVKYRNPDDNSGWWKHPLTDKLKENK